jgi:DNA polymerase III alpha subunit (gram-positive type)
MARLNDFFAIDVETNGPYGDEDRIIDLGAVRFLTGFPVSTCFLYVNFEGRLKNRTSEIIGDTHNILKVAPPAREVIQA